MKIFCYNIFSLILFFGSILLLGGCVLQQNIPVKSDIREPEIEKQPLQKVQNGTEGSAIIGKDVIDLSGRGFTQFPKEILKKTNTKVLILSNNNLKTLPAEIGELRNLEELYLDNNQLEGALPAEIRKMPKLRILDAHTNNLTGIPAEIGQLSNLKEINFSGNSLDTYPLEFGNLKNLTTLNLLRNRYSKESIQSLQKLLPNTPIIW